MKKKEKKRIRNSFHNVSVAFTDLANHTRRHCALIEHLNERIAKLEELIASDRKKGLN